MDYDNKTMNKKEARQLAMMYLKKGDVPDPKIIEFLLNVVDTSTDNASIAKELFNIFGSASCVINSSITDLLRIKNVSQRMAEFLITVGSCARIIDKENVTDFTSEKSVLAFIQSRLMSRTTCEFLEFYLLDRTLKLIDTLSYTSGEYGRAYTNFANISTAVAHTNAKFILMAHNHLDGSVEPSESDFKCTADIATLCVLHNVDLRDHIIYSQGKFFSFAKENLLNNIKLNAAATFFNK